MGMIIAFNALMSCMVTGLFVALFVLLFIKMGWMPAFALIEMPQSEEDLDEQDETNT